MAFLSTSDVQAAWHQNTGYLPITAEAGDATRASGFYDKNPGTDIAVIQMTANQPTANSRVCVLGLLTRFAVSSTRSWKRSGRVINPPSRRWIAQSSAVTPCYGASNLPIAR